MKARQVSVDEFSNDHWSTLLYIETRCVDHRGMLNLEHMRCNISLHPMMGNSATSFSAASSSSTKECPTQLADGTLESNHDDWSCAEDLERVGFIENTGTDINPFFRMTNVGRKVVGDLRLRRSQRSVSKI